MAADIQGRNTFLKPLKWYKSLQDKKGRRLTGCYAVEGIRAVTQVVNVAPHSVDEILIDQSSVFSETNFGGIARRTLTRQQFSGVSAHQTPQGIMAVVKMPAAWDCARVPSQPGARVLFLEDVQDPGNVGTLIRTAVAFGFDGLIMTAQSADPFSPKAVQSSAGSIPALWIRRTESWDTVLEELKANHFSLIAAHMGGQSVWPAKPEDNIIVALGNEGAGISPRLLGYADHIYTIRINRDRAESLNVAVAGGICMCKATGV